MDEARVDRGGVRESSGFWHLRETDNGASIIVHNAEQLEAPESIQRKDVSTPHVNVLSHLCATTDRAVLVR